jgi:hypothetical protein
MAQDTTNTIGHVSIASPNAASLGKYGDIPVSYHTGLPQISIPLYTVESGSLKLPISLSYHASGLKVQEQASWVGSGWALNAGGVITRTVIGAADDRGRNDMGSYVLKGHYTDYGFNSYLTGVPMNMADHYCQIGWYDDEPDLYFFNFGGYTGKFYFNDDRTPILVPEQDFKIQTYYNSQQGFTGFIITTSDGTKYYFGLQGNNGTTSPIETTVPCTTQNGGNNLNAAISSWFLNKIISADGTDSITLEYQTETYGYYTLALSHILVGNYYPSDFTKNGIDLVKNDVYGVRLSKINFPNGSVHFTPASTYRIDLSNNTNGVGMYDGANNSAYALGSISIQNNSGFCKKDSFYYSYFTDATPLNAAFANFYRLDSLHSDKYRLRLDSMQELSCDLSIKLPAYKFTYFGEKVPRKLDFGLDHWGYYNGADTNTALVPTYTVINNNTPTTYNGAYRDAVWPAMRGGTLQKIIYPTGGNTTFDFEPKNIYTFNSTTVEPVNVASYVLHEYGQSTISQTESFSLSGSGNCLITVNNHSTNWSPSLTIYDNQGHTIGGTPIFINVSSTYSTTLQLSTGVNYTATLAFPDGSQSTLINGADCSISEYRNVPTSSSLTVSGLRIKTITQNDGVSPNSIVTSYAYNNSAVLYSRPTYIQAIRNSINALVWPYSPLYGCYSLYSYAYFLSPSSLEPMSTTQGENMGYNEVDVSQTGNGYSIYRYYGSNIWVSNINDVCTRSLTQIAGVCDYTIPDYPAAPIPFEFMRGELQYEGHFDQNGEALKETYYYPVFTPDPLTTPGHIIGTVPGASSTALYFNEYNLQSAAKTQNKIVETDYDPKNSTSLTTTSTIYYNSPFHHQASRKVVTTSTGDSLVTNIKYALDMRIVSCDASIPDSFSYYMNAIQNDQTWMNNNIYSCSPQENTTNNCRSQIYQTYRSKVATDRMNFIAYRRRSYAPDTSNILSRCYASALNTADTLLKPVLKLQNEYYNAPLESSEWKNGNLLHASYTRFDTSQSPVGYVYPGRTQLVNLQSPSTTFTNASVSGHSILKDSRYADESFYIFNNGNPLQVTGRDGVASSYIWDYQNTEPVAKVTNAATNQIAYTSFEADGKGNWTFSGTPVTDISSPTGTRCYLLSNGNISKSLLTSTVTYVVSFWKKAGASVSVSGGTTSYKTGKTINNWTYYEYTVSGATTVTVSGSGNIDELRLYPSNAQMATYTYQPLLGVSSACDADNKISYYFYDGIGRLKWIKDQDGNMTKTIEYHYKQ